MKEAGWNFGMGICNAYLGTDLSVYVPVRLDTNWMQYFAFQMVGRVSLPESNTPIVNSICYNVFIYSQFLYFTFRMWDLPDQRIRAKWVHCQWASQWNKVATIFRLFSNLFYKFNTCTNTFVEINYWIQCCSANRKLQKKRLHFFILDLTEEMSASSVL